MDNALNKDQTIELGFFGSEYIVNNLEGGIKICRYEESLPIVYISEGFTKLTGYTLEDVRTILESKTSDLVVDEDCERVLSDVWGQLGEKREYAIEYKIKHKDGSNIWIRDKGSLGAGEQGEPLVYSVLKDLTMEKNLVAQLELNNKKCELAMSYADFSIFEYDVKTRAMMIHSLEISDYTTPKIIENVVEALINQWNIAERSQESFRQICRSIQKGESTAEAVICTLDANRSEKVTQIRLTNIFDEHGRMSRVIGMKKDLTENQHLKREKQYGNTLMVDKILSYEANITKNKIITYNPQWESELGFHESWAFSFSKTIEFVAKKIVVPEDQELFLARSSIEGILQAYDDGKRLLNFEYRKIGDNQEPEWHEKTLNIIKDDVTGDITIRCYTCNINQKKKKNLKALAEQAYYENMLSKSAVVYDINVTQNILVAGNERWERLFGIEPTENYNEMMLQLSEQAVYPKDREAFEASFLRDVMIQKHENGINNIECDYRRKIDESGKYRWVCLSIHLFEDPENGNLRAFGYVEDINMKKMQQMELVYKSQHDMLTGLYNKNTAEEKIENFLSTGDAKISNHAFLIIDLDFFKVINDTFGHAFGDVVLSSVASKIRLLFREDDILGRIGGDEFIVLMKNIQNEKTAMDKAQEICAGVLETYTQGGKAYQVSVSIGIAIFGDHGRTYEDLYYHSDAALYFSKENGREQCSVFESEMMRPKAREQNIESSDLVERKKFDDNILEYVFRILYESSDKELSINSILVLIGKYYNVSRVYVFENSEDGNCANNTFEWCNNGIESQIDQLQNVPYALLDNYHENFNEEGIFYMPDIGEATPNVRKILEPQKVKSMLQFSIKQKGKFVGFVGFDQCECVRVPTKKETTDFKNIANILGIFIMEMRALERSDESKSIALSIVNGLDAYAYVCDPETYEVLFINEQTMTLVPTARVGGPCYEQFWNSLEPCQRCPMRELGKSEKKKYTMDLFNHNHDVWVRATASWIDWTGGRRTCLVDSVDISDYKVPPEKEGHGYAEK